MNHSPVRPPFFPYRLQILFIVSLLVALGLASSGHLPAQEPPGREPARVYHITPAAAADIAFESDEYWLGRNPAQRFRTAFGDDGIRVVPESAATGWELSLRLTGYGPVGNIMPAHPGRLHVVENRAEIDHGALVEWYVNDARGLEQGFTLRDRSAQELHAETDLIIEMELSGDLLAVRASDGVSVNLYRPGDRLATLRYGQAWAVDAAGRELPVRIELWPGGKDSGSWLRLVVEATGAEYPIEVDPLLTNPPWLSAEEENTYSAAWADWDGDGDLDLAVGNYGLPNRLYENTGAGLDPNAVWASAESDQTRSVAWGDWDNDGDLDLAVGNDGQPNRLYENTGAGLDPNAVWASAESDQTTSVAWGDWDGDSDLDLAVGNYGLPNRLYRNTGSTLDPNAVWASAESDQTTSIAWGDWDGDDDLDLAVANDAEPDRVYGNTGAALDPNAVWSSVDSGCTFGIWCQSSLGVAWGDWDGDGDLDLAVGKRHNDVVWVYENTGAALGSDAVWAFNLQAFIPSRGRSVAWGDWDNDGDLDLGAGSASSWAPDFVFENTGAELNPTPVEYSLICLEGSGNGPCEATRSVAWGDWDNDGDLDIAMGIGTGDPVDTTSRQNKVYENTGNTMLSPDDLPFPPSIWHPRSLAVGDWDDDGDLDLAAAGEGYYIVVYEYSGDRLSSVWTSMEMEQTYSVAWGDWDNDGDLDLAAGNDGQPNRVYLNTGGGLVPFWLSTESDHTRSVAWGDWDGDGDLDLAVGNDGQPNRVYANTGTALDPNATWASTESESTYSIAWGDWDGDGDLDLAVGNNGQPNRVYLNTGGSLVAFWSSAESDPTSSLTWGDWDADGDLDLAVGNDGQPNRVYANTGTALDPNATWASTESESTYSIAWGDWDGDGDFDLAVGNYGTWDRVYPNTGGSLSTSAWTPAPLTLQSTQSVAWGDLDGDGDLDLAAGSATSVLVFLSGRVGRPGLLPDSPVRPVTLDRPGTTASAYFHSTPELLTAPVAIEYRLQDEQSDPAAKIRAEYSVNGGGQWSAATEGPGGDGTVDLAASPAGTPHVFSWDAAADGVDSDNVMFRITVLWQAPRHVSSSIRHGFISATTPPFRVWHDGDGDGLRDRLDCAPGDGDNWSLPTPARNLQIGMTPADNLGWDSPVDPGCTLPAYDVLRSTQAGDFAAAACVESDGTDRIATDSSTPGAGAVFFYLIRAQNPCGDNLGTDSEGTARTGGASCP